MSDIERCWTVFIDTFGRAFDVEDGVSPHAGATARDGSEVVAVVPAEQLRGAVSALDLARGTLKRVAEGCEEPAFGAAMCLKAIDHLHPGGQ
jgi:hypothetical protein